MLWLNFTNGPFSQIAELTGNYLNVPNQIARLSLSLKKKKKDTDNIGKIQIAWQNQLKQ